MGWLLSLAAVGGVAAVGGLTLAGLVWLLGVGHPGDGP